jgi:hypothetical protein
MKYFLTTDPSLKGRPLCFIKDGKFKGNIIYVCQGKPPGDMKPTTYIELKPEDGMIQPLPNLSTEDEQYDVSIFSAPGGAGKSYQVKEMVKAYRKRFPDRPCYLVSQLKSDTTLDSLDPPLLRINLDTLLTQERIDPDTHLEPSFVVVDDFEGLPNKQLKKVWDFINTIATEGRHSSTQLAVVLHTLNNGHHTKTLLRECKNLVIYPSASSFHSYRYALEKQMGMEINEIRALKRIDTRWVWFKTQSPQVMMTEHSVRILHQE